MYYIKKYLDQEYEFLAQLLVLIKTNLVFYTFTLRYSTWKWPPASESSTAWAQLAMTASSWLWERKGTIHKILRTCTWSRWNASRHLPKAKATKVVLPGKYWYGFGLKWTRGQTTIWSKINLFTFTSFHFLGKATLKSKWKPVYDRLKDWPKGCSVLMVMVLGRDKHFNLAMYTTTDESDCKRAGVAIYEIPIDYLWNWGFTIGDVRIAFMTVSKFLNAYWEYAKLDRTAHLTN